MTLWSSSTSQKQHHKNCPQRENKTTCRLLMTFLYTKTTCHVMARKRSKTSLVTWTKFDLTKTHCFKLPSMELVWCSSWVGYVGSFQGNWTHLFGKLSQTSKKKLPSFQLIMEVEYLNCWNPFLGSISDFCLGGNQSNNINSFVQNVQHIIPAHLSPLQMFLGF